MAESRPRAQAPSTAYRVSATLVGVNQGRVTVNNETESIQALAGAPTTCVIIEPPPHTQHNGSTIRQPVTITPISSFPPCSVPEPPSVIQKVLLKAVSKGGKSGSKMFTLHSIDSGKVASRVTLKTEIRGQLHGDIVSNDFDVGYISDNSTISIRNPDDLAEIWSYIKKGSRLSCGVTA